MSVGGMCLRSWEDTPGFAAWSRGKFSPHPDREHEPWMRVKAKVLSNCKDGSRVLLEGGPPEHEAWTAVQMVCTTIEESAHNVTRRQW